MFDVFKRKRNNKKLIVAAGFELSKSFRTCNWCEDYGYVVYDKIVSPAGEIFYCKPIALCCLRCSVLKNYDQDKERYLPNDIALVEWILDKQNSISKQLLQDALDDMEIMTRKLYALIEKQPARLPYR